MPHVLASFRVSKYGDVYIAIRSGDKSRNPGKLRSDSGNGLHNIDIQEFRYSIHPSKDSTTINRLNAHMVYKNGFEKKISTYSSALKLESKFLSLFSRRPVHDLATLYRVNVVSVMDLGEYDDTVLSLYFSVFVSSENTELKVVEQDDTNVTSMVLGQFRITVLWSFCFIPSVTTALTIWYTTAAPADPIANDVEQLGPPEGMLESDVLSTHRNFSEYLFNELIEVNRNTLKFANDQERAVADRFFENSFKLLKNANLKGKDFQKFREKLNTIDTDLAGTMAMFQAGGINSDD